jgi:hypothetical protein
MARTVNEIKAEMTARWMANEDIAAYYELEAGATFEEKFSPASVESIMFYIVAWCAWTVERVVDTYKADTAAALAAQKPHTLGWYGSVILNYMHGKTLVEGETEYDTTGMSDADILAAKVVKVVNMEETDTGLVRAKVNRGDVGAREKLDDIQLAGLKAYFAKVKDAGVLVEFINEDPDNIRLELDVWFDATVLTSEGKRIDGTADTPVDDAVNKYISTLDFDAWFIATRLETEAETTDGVKICRIKTAQVKHGTFQWEDAGARTRAYSGSFRAYEPGDIVVNYHVY